ncbi:MULTISPECIES: hypothetical protein [Staphylococcus]|uniref:hypothetical protein n=1 Tax=Staphylococcus TaxID=1279 RepID=UPI001CDC791E|nr:MULTISPECIES: hypothetical protein [Staphylococcus]MCA2501768.1 hypothetical protein [Staphylococcus xylosus]MCE7780609.1 hypothetical protein [Staphylococcus xylosus]MEB5784506.1 hypothetical protein [Staphylococcus pseudoxylosus]
MYSESEVRELITGYYWRTNLIEDQVYEYDSTSTAQYGIESVMPKAQGGTGDKVLVRVMMNDKNNRQLKKLISETSFVDEHEHKVSNPKNYHLLQLLKRGEKVSTIERLLDISERNIYNRIKQIVKVYMEAQL